MPGITRIEYQSETVFFKKILFSCIREENTVIFFNFPFGVMLHAKTTFTIPSVSLHHLQVQCIHCKCTSCKNLQIMQKWGLHEAPPKYYGISRFGQVNTRKMMTFLVRDRRLKKKKRNTGTEPITIWFHNKNINLPKYSIFSRNVSYITCLRISACCFFSSFCNFLNRSSFSDSFNWGFS